jgi:hypothetical protein
MPRTLQEIDADIMVEIAKIASLAREREEIRPNPIKIKVSAEIPGP